MKKAIVTTTINPPTEAIIKYDCMDDWYLIVVGDVKTPEYKLEFGTYISWEEQESKYPDLCALIGPNSVARGRMIAFIEGYNSGAEIIASIDDDNYPLENWGKDILLDTEIIVDVFYSTDEGLVFNPLWAHFAPDKYHRGYPIELKGIHEQYSIKPITIKPLVRADLWNGDPDVDALDRIVHRPEVVFHHDFLYTHTSKFSPVNTQNTFIHRKAIKDFPANIPFIGRADDIWASYLFEAKHPNSVIYGPASVLHQQERTYDSLLNDLENELFSYRYTYKFLKYLEGGDMDQALSLLPSESKEAIAIYESYFD